MMASRAVTSTSKGSLTWLLRVAIVVTLLAAAGLPAGCGGRQKDKGRTGTPAAGAGRAPASPAAADSAGVAASPNALAPGGAVPPGGGTFFRSDEGRFSVAWPLGCAMIHTRVTPKGASGDKIQFVATGCDLYGKKGEGASVTVYFKQTAAAGGPPGPEAVTSKIEEMTRNLHLEVVEQHVLAGGPYEGIRVFCREAGGTNLMWIQGVLHDSRVYILSAWKPAASRLTDAAVVRFFQSFRMDAS